MEKFVPYAKMSKKQKKEADRARRNTWGPLDPVTRVKKSGKLYDRKRARERGEDRTGSLLLFGTLQTGSSPLQPLEE